MKALGGLDNVVAEGADAFESSHETIKTLGESGKFAYFFQHQINPKFVYYSLLSCNKIFLWKCF